MFRSELVVVSDPEGSYPGQGVDERLEDERTSSRFHNCKFSGSSLNPGTLNKDRVTPIKIIIRV